MPIIHPYNIHYHPQLLFTQMRHNNITQHKPTKHPQTHPHKMHHHHHHQQTDIYNKPKQLRNSIRQRQLQQYLHRKRREYACQLLIEEEKMFECRVERHWREGTGWLGEQVRGMGERPGDQWRGMLGGMMDRVERAGVQGWVDTGLVQKLVMTFKREYLELGLAEMSACILEQILLNLPEQSPQLPQTSSETFIKDLLNLCQSPQTQKQPFLQLTYILLHKTPSLAPLFLENELPRILLHTLSLPIGKQSYEIVLVLEIVHRLFRLASGAGKASCNLMAVFGPALARLLGELEGDGLRVGLKCLSLLATSQKEYVLADLFHSPSLVDLLLDFLSSPDSVPFTRSASSNILASMLAAENPKYARSLVHKGILDTLLKAWNLPINHQQFYNNLLKIISNITSASLDLAKTVLAHEIFTVVVLPECKNYHKQNNYSDAIFILATMVQYGNLQILDNLMRKFYILEIFVCGLRQDFISVGDCVEILEALTVIVKFYGSADENGREKIVRELESLYNIETVLQIMEQKIANKKVQICVSILLEEMYGQS